MTIELSLVLSLVERVLGGPVGKRVAGRKLSDIDRALAGHIFEQLLDQLSVTWSDLAGDDAQARRPRDAARDRAARAALRAHPLPVDGGAPGPRLVDDDACSSRTARSTRSPTGSSADAYDDDGTDDGASAERMHRAMRGVDVQLRAEVAAVPLAAEDVLGLKSGDVLRFGRAAETGVTALRRRDPRLPRPPGRHGNRRAVQVARAPGGGAMSQRDRRRAPRARHLDGRGRRRRPAHVHARRHRARRGRRSSPPAPRRSTA